MPLKTRRTLFYVLTILFVIASVVVILYSKGFRFDFENRGIAETGGIYIKSEPAESKITIDGKEIKNDSGILQSGTLITNLIPDSYGVGVSLDGYNKWKKNAYVESGKVSVFDNIILFPKDEGKIISSSTDLFYVKNGKIITNKDSEPEFEGKEIIGTDVSKFTDNGTVISYNKINGNYYLSNIFDLSSSLNLSLIFNNLKEARLGLPGYVPIVKIEPYPYNDRKFIVMTARAPYTLDTERLSIEQISESTDGFAVSGNETILFNGDGIFGYNLIFRNTYEIANSKKIDTGNIKKIQISPSGEMVGVLKKDGKLEILNTRTRKSEVVSQSAYIFIFSQDSKKVVFVEGNGAVVVYYFDEEDSKRDQKIDLINISYETANKIMWHKTNGYIFLKTKEGNLRFIEVDDSQPINEILVSDKVKSFTYDNEFLYFDDGDSILRLEI